MKMSTDAFLAAAAPQAPTDSLGMELRCPQCDYDLRAMVSDRCPECGMTVDRAALARSQIPWTYRGEMGAVRAYVRTTWMVFRNPRRIAMEAARPVSFEDARAFRNVTVWLAFVPLACLIVWAYIEMVPHPTPASSIVAPNSAYELAQQRPDVRPPHWRLALMGQSVVALSAGGALWLYLLMATSVGSYFFHPASLSIARQNRAVALSYYACATVGVMPVTVLLAAATILVNAKSSPSNFKAYEAFAILLCSTIGLLGLQIVSWVRCSLSILRYATRCSWVWSFAFAAFLPAAWIALVPLVLVGLPLFVLLMVVVTLSIF